MEQKSEAGKKVRTRSIIIWVASLIVFSGVLFYSLRFIEDFFKTSLAGFALYAYGIVFVFALLTAATVIFPIPATAVVAAAAAKWNPIIVALVAGTGAALGELVGYYAGFLGVKSSSKGAEEGLTGP